MGTLTSLSRLFQTVRYLRPVQVYGRLAQRLPRRAALACEVAPPAREPAENWQPARGRQASMFEGGRFRFINQEHVVATAGDWNNPAWSRLWLYNLHYFDDLMADGAATRQPLHGALIARWIAENPAEAGPGWEPYCLSRRIVNWCQWAWCGHLPDGPARASLVVQTRSLALQIETHLLGNHLMANAKALMFAGVFFTGDEADRWLAAGATLLRREVGEQVMADGGHFERSPMYHGIILEDLLDLVYLAKLFPGRLDDALVRELVDRSCAMVVWLTAMCHPDGEISFFNDSAFGIARHPRELVAHAEQLGCGGGATAAPPAYFSDSGYARLSRGRAVVIADVGEIGPDYLPGHAHADTLSFEMSLHGQRLLVNSGTSTYAASDERLRQRGTAAHNTVVVDGLDSSEVWSSFRVARRARPGTVALEEEDGCSVLRGSHDGYQRLPGRATHHRVWRLSETMLTVEDRIAGGFAHACVRWHLHPDAVVRQDGARGFEISLADKIVHVQFSGCTPRILDSTWSPEFGMSVPNAMLEATFDGKSCRAEWRWA